MVNPLRWASENALRTAGIVGAAAAAAYVVVASGSADAGGSSGTAVAGGVSPAAVVEFSATHPAYLAAVVVGLGVFLFLD